MVGLSWLPVICAVRLLAVGQPEALHQVRLAELLAAPAPADTAWQGMVFQSASRLEHAPTEQTLPAWQILAAAGGDAELGNLILFCRRHGLPLPDADLDEGVDAHLERALAAWGERDLERAAALLRDGLSRWPADDRYRSNLLWLERQAPAALTAGADARALALGVLAARGALP